MKRNEFLKLVGVGALVPVLPFPLYPKPLKDGIHVTISRADNGEIISHEILPHGTNQIMIGQDLEPNTEYNMQVTMKGNRNITEAV